MQQIKYRNAILKAMLAGACMTFCMYSSATELVYVPVNPAFGGSPLNGSVLLNSAQSQDKHKDPNDPSSLFKEKTPLQQFNDVLQRRVLDDLATVTTKSVIKDGKLIPGTIQSGDFRIVITDLGGGMLQITTTDRNTGASTTFQVAQ